MKRDGFPFRDGFAASNRRHGSLAFARGRDMQNVELGVAPTRARASLWRRFCEWLNRTDCPGCNRVRAETGTTFDMCDECKDGTEW